MQDFINVFDDYVFQCCTQLEGTNTCSICKETDNHTYFDSEIPGVICFDCLKEEVKRDLM
jgi:hypothetical protein